MSESSSTVDAPQNRSLSERCPRCHAQTPSSDDYKENRDRPDPSFRPYDVFISHRGPDVKDLASILYRMLHIYGIKAFFDIEEFQPGQELSATITDAIRTSSVHIAIFSPNYAESQWCLKELRLMLQRRVVMIPVFYNVVPGDLVQLKAGKGVFANALNKLAMKSNGDTKRCCQEDIDRWRDALTQAPNHSGLVFRDAFNQEEIDRWRDTSTQAPNHSGLVLPHDFNGIRDRGELLHKIVSNVVKHFRKNQKAVSELVGLEARVGDFEHFVEKLIKENKNVIKKVGIVGPAGCGKTSLAEEYYYQQRGHFDRSSLLLGIRKASERDRLPTLQKQLVKDLTNDEFEEIDNILHGRRTLADRAGRLRHTASFKFLIIIDDIDYQEQLDALLPDDKDLGSESVVIVTARDKAVLKLSKISSCYEIKPLTTNDAEMLLLTHAFHTPEPICEFKEWVKTAVLTCGCLPEILKIIGRNLLLYGTNKNSWDEELQMIFEIPEIIEATYDALGEEEKQIFLDIACFFEGKERDLAIRAWCGSGWKGVRALKKLEYMSLVQMNKNNQLKMEDYFCELGRHIADQQLRDRPDLPFRLWRPDDVAKFLPGLLPPQMTKHTHIRGFTEGVKATRRHHQPCGRKELKRCPSPSIKIELLDVEGDLHLADYRDFLRDLVWFRWRSCHSTIPPLEMSNLRVLELVKGNLETLWDFSFQVNSYSPRIIFRWFNIATAQDENVLVLRFFQICTFRTNIKTIWRTLQPPSQLRELNVTKCRKLREVPQTIGSLKHLEKMTLNGSVCLKTLPVQFCELEALQHLELKECEGLTSLPEKFGQLTNLHHLDLTGCKKLSELPRSFGQLKQLKNLQLHNCIKMLIQINMFKGITTLEVLNFENCQVQNFPCDLTCQTSLRELNLRGTNFVELPENMEKLTNLEHLVIGSDKLSSIPRSVWEMRSLRKFELFGCTSVTGYPASIGELHLSGKTELGKCYVYCKKVKKL